MAPMKSRFLNVEAGSRRTVKVMWYDLRKVQLATADLKMEERATSQRIWQLLEAGKRKDMCLLRAHRKERSLTDTLIFSPVKLISDLQNCKSSIPLFQCFLGNAKPCL